MALPLVMIAFLLSACAGEAIQERALPDLAEGERYIRDEALFRELVVGKILSDSGGSVVIAKDGTFDGQFRNGRFFGTWRWADGYFCRQGQIGRSEVPPDCKLISIKDDRLSLKASKGIGQDVIFVISPQ